MGCSRPLFLQFLLLNIVDGKQMFNKFFANDWIWAVDLWFWKWPLYQLSHCHYLKNSYFRIVPHTLYYIANDALQGLDHQNKT